jgi:F-type H+-transporting ATPase subunit gamma
MANLKEIQTRIVSLQTTKKLTDAMKMLAITQYRRANKLFSPIDSFANDFKKTTQYVKPIPQGDVKYLIVMAPSRGLCGSLNTKLNRFLKNQYEGYKIISVGATAEEEAEYLRYPKDNFLPFLKQLLAKITDYQEIKVAYVHFTSTTRYNIQETTVFPWTYNEDDKFFVLNEVEDFDTWFKKYLVTALYQAFFHTHIAENASRMLAMDGASKNTQKLIQELKLLYNKKRQELITKEILETGVSIYDE